MIMRCGEAQQTLSPVKRESMEVANKFLDNWKAKRFCVANTDPHDFNKQASRMEH